MGEKGTEVTKGENGVENGTKGVDETMDGRRKENREERKGKGRKERREEEEKE